MSHEHNHDDCDCDHHHPEVPIHSGNNPCPTEQFVEKLLKDLEKEKDL